MYALPNRRSIRGNLKVLMSVPLALIAGLYLLAGPGGSSDDPVDPAASAAVAAALTANLQVRDAIDQLVVTAPRLAPAAFELNLEQPLVEVAVVATPPSIQRDPS